MFHVKLHQINHYNTGKYNEKNNNTPKDNIVEKVKEIAKEEDTKYSTVDLDGTYYTNPLKCEKKTEKNSNLDGKELEWISSTKEVSFHLPAGTYYLT